jgi:hypothetical protein
VLCSLIHVIFGIKQIKKGTPFGRNDLLEYLIFQSFKM